MFSIFGWMAAVIKDASIKLLGTVLAAVIALLLAARGIRIEDYLDAAHAWLLAQDSSMLAFGGLALLVMVAGSFGVIVARWGRHRGYPSVETTKRIRLLARELETNCLAPIPSPLAEEALARFRDQQIELASFRRIAPLMGSLADEADQYMIACIPGSGLAEFADEYHEAALRALNDLRRSTAWAVDNFAADHNPVVAGRQ